nr:hypothetical protein [Tanacetum cinerariifolium]
MTLLNKLMKTCATLTQKVAHLEHDKVTQVLEITKLKQRVRKLERGIIELDVDENVTLVDADTVVEMDADTQGRMEEDVTTVKEVSATEPTVFDDEEEKDYLEKAKVLQQQYDQKQENIDWNVVVEQMQEKHLDNIKKYQSLKRKPISVAQARKNMIVYLKNMVGYNIQHFKGMTYDKKLKSRVLTLHDKKKHQVLILQKYLKKMFKICCKLSQWLSSKWKPYKSSTLSLNGKFTQKDQDLIGEWLELVESHKHSKEKDYPFTNQVMTLMLSSRLQVEEDSEVARDLVMKIFLKANQPQSKSLDTSSN